MPIKHRRFKTAIVTFTSPVLADFSCQMLAMAPTNAAPDGERFYTFCADGNGEGREDVDPDWSLALRGKHDWTPGGISRYLHANDGARVEIAVNFDNGVTDWDRTWTGTVVIKSPGDGGDARAAQEFDITLMYEGAPELEYNS